MIRSENLVKKYGNADLELTVLKNLNIQIEKGEFVAIIGPSGAGKSTLLYQLSLLDVPTSGGIYINGKNMSVLPEKEKTEFRLRELGYVFQDYALLPELTALENVALPMLMQGLSYSDAVLKAKVALSTVGLSEKLGNLPSQLSGGQQQRVSIARAIAHGPHILFADEPTANLDSISAEPVMEAFSELHKSGQTIIMVTHEVEYASKAGRIITLKDGLVVSDKKI
ncbi:MAG: ABC transporter ATP-binding protein [Candidatus Taylorbacteria bacterium]|nr:ABC transporter ATP-binding protein [Candidatus Taylorbacteria bacterium]